MIVQQIDPKTKRELENPLHLAKYKRSNYNFGSYCDLIMGKISYRSKMHLGVVT